MAVTEQDIAGLQANIAFFNEWLATDHDVILNPANNELVTSFRRIGVVGETFNLTEVFSQDVDLVDSTWRGTGWTIPESGLFRIDVTNPDGQGRVYPGQVLSAAELRALPAVNAGSPFRPTGQIVYNTGSSTVSNDYYFLRSFANELMIRAGATNEDPTPLVVNQITFTGTGIGQKGPKGDPGDMGPQGLPGATANFRYTQVHSQNVDITTANRWTDTGWDIPATGMFRFDITATVNRLIYPGVLISAEQLRATPPAVINTPTTLQTLTGAIAVDSAAQSAVTDYVYTRTASNRLLVTINSTVLDPTPFTVWQLNAV